MMTTAAARSCTAAVVVLTVMVPAGPAMAHDEGLTPYRYVNAPPGVESEGAAEPGRSTQPLGEYGFAGTTDNQMQLTLPEGVLPTRPGETGVRVELDQLDPTELPPLPPGLEPEGNGYRVSLAYAPSGTALQDLAGPASLGLSAPAAPTEVYQLVDGTWVPVEYTPVAVDAGFSSVVVLNGPGTFLQAYDPSTAPSGGVMRPGPAAVEPEYSAVEPDAVEPEPAAVDPAAAAERRPVGGPSGQVLGAGVGAAALLLGGVVALRRRPTAR